MYIFKIKINQQHLFFDFFNLELDKSIDYLPGLIYDSYIIYSLAGSFYYSLILFYYGFKSLKNY